MQVTDTKHITELFTAMRDDGNIRQNPLAFNDILESTIFDDSASNFDRLLSILLAVGVASRTSSIYLDAFSRYEGALSKIRRDIQESYGSDNFLAENTMFNQVWAARDVWKSKQPR